MSSLTVYDNVVKMFIRTRGRGEKANELHFVSLFSLLTGCNSNPHNMHRIGNEPFVIAGDAGQRCGCSVLEMSMSMPREGMCVVVVVVTAACADVDECGSHTRKHNADDARSKTKSTKTKTKEKG